MVKTKYQKLPHFEDSAMDNAAPPTIEVDLNEDEPTPPVRPVSPTLENNHPVNNSRTSVQNVNESSASVIMPMPVLGAASASPPQSELPSYVEAIRLKKLEGNDQQIPPSYLFSQDLTHSNISNHDHPANVSIDAADLRAIAEAQNQDSQLFVDQDIGSECMFLSAFMIAFFFNWIGFLASICLLPNAAGKYGALSGFGLSMAKWVTIVRYQDWMTNMNDFQQKIFFWLFVFLGFYLFFRGLINYMTLRYRPAAGLEYSRRLRNRWFWFVT